MFNTCRHLVCLALTLVLTASAALAADQSKKISSETLRNDQLAVSGRYDRFERLLSQMADLLGHEDPERAELLRRAISKGREKTISAQLGRIATDLGQNNLGTALEQQEEVIESLTVLLKLLQSEDRRSELEKERERLNKLLKDVSNTLNQQKSARARTKNATAPSSASPEQRKAIERADRILDDIREHDGRADDAADTEDANNETQSADSEQNPSDDSSDDGSNEDSRAGQSKDPASDGESPSDAESSDNEASENSQSQSQQSQSQQSQSQQSQSQQSQSQQTPGREQIAEARRSMQEALDKLQQQLRDEAEKNQDDAIDALQQAIEELRKQLLQLREEEKEMVLASLEARFQRMLTVQTQIYDETTDLNATPVDQWLDTMFARSREVAQHQAELQIDCEQTLGLLKEDGTSVAIVLSVEDISVDMRSVAGRLKESKVGALTQTLETDIIDSLKELIEATQREMREMKSEERQQQMATGDPQKPSLVDLMAEIKVLRSLQLRLNRRTQQIDQLMAEQDSGDRQDLFRQLEELTARQQRLVESAAELGERLTQ